MTAEPSQDARADQPTETICMFTLRGDNHERAASDIRDEADQSLCEVHDWTQTTRVIPAEVEMTQDERRQLDEHGFTLVPVKGGQGRTSEDLAEFAGIVLWLGKFVLAAGAGASLAWMWMKGWTQ